MTSLLKRFPYLWFALCCALYMLPFLRILIPSADQGTFLYGAVRVLEGQVPARDFFEVMAPGSFYWLALFFKLFGTTWAASRVALIVTWLGIAVLIYGLARRLQTECSLVPPVLFVSASFGVFWPAISHHSDSNLFALLAFAVFLRWLDKRRTWLIAAAGCLAGLTTCFMQPKGLLLFLSFLLLLVVICNKEGRFWPALLWLTGGFVAIGLAALTAFWLMGGLQDLFYANVVWPLTNYRSVNTAPYGSGINSYFWSQWTTAFSSVAPLPVAFGIAGVLMLPFLLVVALPGLLAVLAALHRQVAFRADAIPFWVVGTALWLSELHRKNVVHLVSGSIILVILVICLCARLPYKSVRFSLQLLAVSGFALALFNVMLVLWAGNTLDSRRGVVRTFQPDPLVRSLEKRIQPGEPFFVYPYKPIYYFLTAGRNPTRFSVLMHGYNTAGEFDEVLRSLDQKKVRYVLWDTAFEKSGLEVFFPAYRKPRPEDRIVESYLCERYSVVESGNGWQILERKSESAFQTD